MYEASSYQNNELYETFTAHEHTNGERFPPDHSAEPRGHGGTNRLGEEGGKRNGKYVSPSGASVQQPKIGLQARQRKVEWQEKRAYQVFQFLGYVDIEPLVTRDDEAGHEGTKDGMDSNDASEERGSESNEKDEGDDALRRAVFNAPVSTQDPAQCRLYGKEQSKDEAKRGEQNPERVKASTCVDESHAESQKNPAFTIVSLQ
ncbi:hypothetical protein E4U10_002168 [Claviceps purpurea]|nr:hypothetical protein E4U36_004645 [Claviceps purpurea]KAG6201997.1 hypothetical protein E4U10_002168 [Claviceps purpurea]